jgi:hypothetical protein
MKPLLVVVAIAACLVLACCAPGPNPAVDQPDPEGRVAGFWLGLWHGFTLLFTFVASLLWDGVFVYEAHNSGHLYDLGFLFGVMLFFGGGSGGACSRPRR